MDGGEGSDLMKDGKNKRLLPDPDAKMSSKLLDPDQGVSSNPDPLQYRAAYNTLKHKDRLSMAHPLQRKT